MNLNRAILNHENKSLHFLIPTSDHFVLITIKQWQHYDLLSEWPNILSKV